MLDQVIFNLTINYARDKIYITSKKVLAQLRRVPYLYVQQCFFLGVHYGIKKLIEKLMTYSMTFKE